MRSYMIQNFPVLHLYHPTLNTRSIFVPPHPSCGCWQSADSCHSCLRGLWFLMTLCYRTLWPSAPYIRPEETKLDLLRTSHQTLKITHSYTICGKIQSLHLSHYFPSAYRGAIVDFKVLCVLIKRGILVNWVI